MNERTFRTGDSAKLEDPERLKWLPPAEILALLDLRPGETAADIGAGTGYFAIPIAARIAPGKLYAVDLQPEMLDKLRAKLAAPGVPTNIELLRGAASATNLPDASVDLVLMANLWHELDSHDRVLREVDRILRPGGRLAILDWRRDVSPPPGPPSGHRVALQDALGCLEANAWRLRGSADWPFSYLILAARNSLHATPGTRTG
ncbi:MAG: class I SAM-dependent methyltransferase [Bryobacteraceae bacterium]